MNIKKILSNMKNNKDAFFSNIVSMIVVFVMLNVAVFGIYALNTYKTENRNSNQIIIYLSGLTDEEKTEFQKKLLSVNGVESLNYESKEVALKSVSKELGIELSEAENPLADAFYVYIDENVDLDQLKHQLESYSEISEIDLRTNSITSNRTFSDNMTKFVYVSTAIAFIFGGLMIHHLSVSSVKNKAKKMVSDYNKFDKKIRSNTRYFIEDLVILALSYSIGYAIYIKIREFIIVFIKNIIVTVSYTSTYYEVLVSIIILIATILLLAFINYVLVNRQYKIYLSKNETIINKDLEIDAESEIKSGDDEVVSTEDEIKED